MKNTYFRIQAAELIQLIQIHDIDELKKTTSEHGAWIIVYYSIKLNTRFIKDNIDWLPFPSYRPGGKNDFYAYLNNINFLPMFKAENKLSLGKIKYLKANCSNLNNYYFRQKTLI